MRAVRVRRAAIAVVAVLAVLAVLAVAQAGAVIAHAVGGEDSPTGAAIAAVPALVRAPSAPPRTVGAYRGLGTWVDVYDTGATGAARVEPSAVDAMALTGVRTLYLQAARDDGHGTPAVTDPGRLAEFLVRAHRRGLRVVGWYVPRFGDIERDRAYLRAVADFAPLGHRFDGVAVDIEWTGTVTDDAQRSDRVVELSTGLRRALGGGALGAIVLPPVQTEVVNPALWPAFPWRRLAPLYDVWLPMAYWTERAPASGYRDARRYTGENLTRLRNDLGRDAPVHAIGGLGAQTTAADVDAFAAALARAEGRGADVIGASLYDWATITPALRARLARALPAVTGAGGG